jgi:hypothetical protein
MAALRLFAKFNALVEKVDVLDKGFQVLAEDVHIIQVDVAHLSEIHPECCRTRKRCPTTASAHPLSGCVTSALLYTGVDFF